MQSNTLPKYDVSDNPTGCCPRFNPEGWDAQDLHFSDKLFVKAETRSLFHMPINMGSVFARTFAAIEAADALDYDDFIVMSFDQSSWSAEHYIAVHKEVEGQEMSRLSGDYLTHVFEGPYRKVPVWEQEMQAFVKQQGSVAEKIYFFYTTCPKCAKTYGKNYVVAVAELKAED